MVELAMKVCSKCGQEKPRSDFNNFRHSKDGKQAWCIACKRDHIRFDHQQQAEDAIHAYYAYQRLLRLSRNYGVVLNITEDDVLDLVRGNGWVCSNCGSLFGLNMYHNKGILNNSTDLICLCNTCALAHRKRI